MNGNRKCRALYDFTAEAEDDLSLRKNDEPTILEQVIFKLNTLLICLSVVKRFI